MRLTVHVRPGAKRPGLAWRDGVLTVHVRERAVEGRATAAALAAVAEALGVAKRDVALVAGARSRTKIVEVPDDAAGRLAALTADADGDPCDDQTSYP